MPDVELVPQGDPNLLREATVVFTGRLASMTQEEASDVVRALGGHVAERPSRSGSILVVAEDARERERRGAAPKALSRARELIRQGHAVRILNEKEFLRALGLEDHEEGVHRYYTTGQLGRILDLPRDRIRFWVRMGLLRPAKVVHRLAYFDFRQVREAKALAELARAGVPLDRIREALRKLGQRAEELDNPLASLDLVVRDGEVLVRLDSGDLQESTGQFRLPFGSRGDRGEPPPDPEPRTIEDWLDLALHHEQAGRLEDAEHAYRRALSTAGPQPVLCFNLANVLYALGRKERAAERFCQAVEMDPEYVEAWNNLGNVLGDLEEYDDAIRAYVRAIELAPDYPDPHYNLAETYRIVGESAAAREHWLTYLRIDPKSPWAERIREELRDLGGPETPVDSDAADREGSPVRPGEPDDRGDGGRRDSRGGGEPTDGA